LTLGNVSLLRTWVLEYMINMTTQKYTHTQTYVNKFINVY